MYRKALDLNERGLGRRQKKKKVWSAVENTRNGIR